ncbi:DUF3013 family protein [Enterococcus timonensis]|uniref:DUF3013 family protein n=1 Tax=Enterococcus timonensis TaxID=1852364 RepID=UPI0008DA468F|nr:DUF3013 family protein [Enterococcus timonensis]
MSTDAIEFLVNYAQEKLAPYEGEVVWNSKDHTIEIIASIFAANEDRILLEDANDLNSNEELVEFSDGILFFDQKKRPSTTDYLVLLAFDRKKGISTALLQGAIDYFVELLAKGQDDLVTFLADEQAEIFELTWDESRFQQIVKQYGDMVFLPYPKF